MRAANESVTGRRATREATLARAARAAREQQTALALETQASHPAHTASHNRTAAVALNHPAEAEVDNILRFPQYSLYKCDNCFKKTGDAVALSESENSSSEEKKPVIHCIRFRTDSPDSIP
jgi:hypothetical protein